MLFARISHGSVDSARSIVHFHATTKSSTVQPRQTYILGVRKRRLKEHRLFSWRVKCVTWCEFAGRACCRRRPIVAVRPGFDRRRREGHLGSRPAGRDGGSVEPRAHRKGPHRRHGRQRAVPHRRSSTGQLRRHVQPVRVRHRPAGGRRVDRVVCRDGERRSEGGCGDRDDYGRRRDAGRGCRQRQTAAHRHERHDQRHSHRAALSQSRDARPGRHAVGISGCGRPRRSGDRDVHHAWRPGQRGPAHHRRIVARCIPEWHGRLVHRGRHTQRPGSGLHDGRRTGRIRSRRSLHEPGAAPGREQVLGVVLRELGQRVVADQQLHGCDQGVGASRAEPDDQDLGYQRLHRRPDRERQAVVLHRRSVSGQPEAGGGDVQQLSTRATSTPGAMLPHRRRRPTMARGRMATGG